MARIGEKQVNHIAKLANLRLAPQEVKKFCHQLSKILNYIQQLEEVDTQNVAPTNQVTDLENVFREDKVKRGLTFKGFFKTKIILKKEK